MEQLIIAILDRIDSELRRCYWNKNQKEINSPFQNGGEIYANDTFTVRPYYWGSSEDKKDLPNFESAYLRCWWYKHSHRGLSFEIIPDITVKELSEFLNDCLERIRRDFGENDADCNK